MQVVKNKLSPHNQKLCFLSFFSSFLKDEYFEYSCEFYLLTFPSFAYKWSAKKGFYSLYYL